MSGECDVCGEWGCVEWHHCLFHDEVENDKAELCARIEALEKRLEAAENYIVALYDGNNDRIDEAWDELDKETQGRLAKADAALAGEEKR